MQPVKAETEDLQNLIAFLSRLTGVQPGMPIPGQLPAAGGIDFSRILNPKPGDWLTYNGKLSGNRYSDLKQINTSNVNKLALKWTLFDSAVDTVSARHSLLSREHAVLRIGDCSDRCRRHYVCDRTEPGMGR